MHDVRTFELFAGLTAAELAVVDSVVRRRQFNENDVLIDQSQPSDGAYIVLSGTVCVSLRQTDSSLTNLFTLESPVLVGERALLDLETPTATVVATSKAEALYIDRRRFAGLCAQEHTASTKILAALAGILRCRCRRLDAEIVNAIEKIASDTEKPHPMLPFIAENGGCESAIRTVDSTRQLDLRAIAEWGVHTLRSLEANSIPLGGPADAEIDLDKLGKSGGMVILRGATTTVYPYKGGFFPIQVDGPGCFTALSLPVDPEPALFRTYSRTDIVGLALPEAVLDSLLQRPSDTHDLGFATTVLRALCRQLSRDMRRRNHYLVRIMPLNMRPATDQDSSAAVV